MRDITTNADDAAIVKAVIGLGHAMRLKVIAEGVETKEQLEFLRLNDCDEKQGYLFSRPVPAEDMTKMLRENRLLTV